jgi:hypothetical protein
MDDAWHRPYQSRRLRIEPITLDQKGKSLAMPDFLCLLEP